jgi:hypothetical protein
MDYYIEGRHMDDEEFTHQHAEQHGWEFQSDHGDGTVTWAKSAMVEGTLQVVKTVSGPRDEALATVRRHLEEEGVI